MFPREGISRPPYVQCGVKDVLILVHLPPALFLFCPAFPDRLLVVTHAL
jgi:hypothetical protein